METKEIIAYLQTLLQDDRHSPEVRKALKAAIKKLKNARTREHVIEVIKFLASLFSNLF